MIIVCLSLLFVDCCLLFVICSLFLDACCVLFAAWCLVIVASLLSNVCRSLLVIRRLLFVVCGSLFAMRRLLCLLGFVARSCSLVVSCWLWFADCCVFSLKWFVVCCSLFVVRGLLLCLVCRCAMFGVCLCSVLVDVCFVCCYYYCLFWLFVIRCLLLFDV